MSFTARVYRILTKDEESGIYEEMTRDLEAIKLEWLELGERLKITISHYDGLWAISPLFELLLAMGKDWHDTQRDVWKYIQEQAGKYHIGKPTDSWVTDLENQIIQEQLRNYEFPQDSIRQVEINATSDKQSKADYSKMPMRQVYELAKSGDEFALKTIKRVANKILDGIKPILDERDQLLNNPYGKIIMPWLEKQIDSDNPLARLSAGQHSANDIWDIVNNYPTEAIRAVQVSEEMIEKEESRNETVKMLSERTKALNKLAVLWVEYNQTQRISKSDGMEWFISENTKAVGLEYLTIAEFKKHLPKAHKAKVINKDTKTGRFIPKSAT